VAVVVALGVGVVAGRATFSPPQTDESALPEQTYTVAPATVGSSATYTATVTWPVTPLATGGGSGTVTSVAVEPGAEVAAGSVLYSLDLRPVVVAQGAVPSFRDLSRGTTGADVAQLQQLLVGLGHLATQPTGTFDARTEAAVKAWQGRLGVERTGVVRAGDVVFAPTLPARVVLDDAVKVGATLSPGTSVVGAVAAAPRFDIVVSGDQRTAVPETGTAVHVAGEGGAQWDATVASATTDELGAVTLHLAGPSGGSVCGDTCAAVPFTTDTLRYPAQVVLQPEVTGPAVPIASLGTSPDGSRFVTLPDGTRVPVTVRASDGSRAVVDGADEGTVVLLFGEGGTSESPTPEPSDGA
jgi:peptidoglycan hydrolase-like protein with peptidoglycan-binding domain